jgi:hypothetical protein
MDEPRDGARCLRPYAAYQDTTEPQGCRKPRPICTIVQMKWSCQRISAAAEFPKCGDLNPSSLKVKTSADADQRTPYCHDRSRSPRGLRAERLWDHQRKARRRQRCHSGRDRRTADAPPRPDTAKYDEYMRERERKRLLPASERDKEEKPAPAAPDAAR